MPIEKTIYKCKMCGKTYDLYHEAVACETIPLPPEKQRVGNLLQFTNEEYFGGRWSYGGDSGTIKLITLEFNSHTSNHAWCYFVDTGRYVAIIFEVDHPDGYLCMYDYKTHQSNVPIIQQQLSFEGILYYS